MTRDGMRTERRVEADDPRVVAALKNADIWEARVCTNDRDRILYWRGVAEGAICEALTLSDQAGSDA